MTQRPCVLEEGEVEQLVVRQGGREIAAKAYRMHKKIELYNKKKIGMNEGAEIRNSWLC